MRARRRPGWWRRRGEKPTTRRSPAGALPRCVLLSTTDSAAHRCDDPTTLQPLSGQRAPPASGLHRNHELMILAVRHCMCMCITP